MFRTLPPLFAILALLLIYGLEAFCVLHPHVSRDYREFYIENVASDWNVGRYNATLEQGITFSALGLPTFVRTTFGLSYREPWGRWTDAEHTPVPRISLSRPLTGPVCLDIKTQAAQSQKGKPVMVSLGDETRTVVFDKPGYSDYLLDFFANKPADSVEFRFSGPVPPADQVNPKLHDHRRLGLSLVSMRFIPHTCASIAGEAPDQTTTRNGKRRNPLH